MFRPGFTRGILGLILGMVGGVVALAVLRLILGLIGQIGASEPLIPSSGTALLCAGFAGGFGWLWGVGSFNPHSHEHHGLEHALEHPEPSPFELLMARVRKATPGIVSSVRPLIQPLLVALGIAAVVLVVIMAFGIFAPIHRVTTEVDSASAVTAAGTVMLPFSDTPVNKTVVFIGLTVIILGILGGLSIVIALAMNALGNEVQVVKKTPDEPLATEPPLFRLIDFFVSWVKEILDGTKRSVIR
ncbi:MAG: hypothetical protein ABI947_21045 [Chloroflexota bacterium]